LDAAPGEIVNDPYRRIARFYDGLLDRPNAVMRRIGLAMVPPKDGMTVLEVGCGTGANLVLYQRAGCEVAGVDLSPSMLEVARAKLGETADLRLCDAADMPYRDGSFDLVVAFLTLHEMPPDVRESVLDEMVRVAGPNGRLLLIDFHPGPLRFPRGWLFKSGIVVLEVSAGREHFRNYRDFLAREGVRGLVDKRSLTVVKEKVLSAGNVLACELRR
jgi:demethylmenaquinone methyltransferase/2-methoxy-6-polyprenyl-1,4-benzoquinol methylase